MTKKPILERAQITNAWAEALAANDSPALWKTGFLVSSEGASNLGAAIARLSKLQPPGMVAVILDGKVKSLTPLTPLPGGKVARIQGGSNETEATELALILLSGALESDLGSDVSGSFVARTPVSFSYYGAASPDGKPKPPPP